MIARHNPPRGGVANSVSRRRHTFSFFGPLSRSQSHGSSAPSAVINEDRDPAGRLLRPPGQIHRYPGDHLVCPGGRARAQGPHRHRLGHPPGDVQVRSAVTGHPPQSSSSLKEEPVHFLPADLGACPTGRVSLAPRYDQKTFADSEKPRSPAPRRLAQTAATGSVLIHQARELRSRFSRAVTR